MHHAWLAPSYVDNRLGRGPVVLNGDEPSSASLVPALSLLSSRFATVPYVGRSDRGRARSRGLSGIYCNAK